MPLRSALDQRFMDTASGTPMPVASLMRESMKAQNPPGMARGAPERLGPVKRMINEALVGEVVAPLVQKAEAARQKRNLTKNALAGALSTAIDNRKRVESDIEKTQSDEERDEKRKLAVILAKQAFDMFTHYQSTADPTDPVQKEIDDLLAEDEAVGGDLLSFGEGQKDYYMPDEGFIVNPREAEIMDQRKMLTDLYERFGIYHNVGPGPEGRGGAHGTRAPAELWNPAAIGEY